MPAFHFQWREADGPAVAEPVKRGFGSRLIERLLANDFGGEVRIDYAAGGVVCKLSAPLSNLGLLE